MDSIKRSLLIRDLTDITIASSPYFDKDQRKQLVKGIENQLRKLEKLYNIDNIDDSLPEAGAFDKLRALLPSKPKKKK